MKDASVSLLMQTYSRSALSQTLTDLKSPGILRRMLNSTRDTLQLIHRASRILIWDEFVVIQPAKTSEITFHDKLYF